MTDLDDAIVEAIIKIGNHPKIVKQIEPNICEPLKLEPWMVVRTIKVWNLLWGEWGNHVEK